MKKILYRGGLLPTETYTPEHFFSNNLIGDNIGNLLYVYGILRNIVTDDDFQIVSTRYKFAHLNPKIINREYSAFIIPLADAFRADFVRELDKLTKLVKSLKIPCYVIGVGLCDRYEPTFKTANFPFNDNVKKFVSAVLKKSAIIGTRGQITCDYLSMLGFKEGRDHMPIGCPSMYTYGPNLHVENLSKIHYSDCISLNASGNAPKKIKDFLSRTIKLYPNFTFAPQSSTEFKYIYTGIPFHEPGKHVPLFDDFPLVEGNHIKFFTSIYSWFKYFDDIKLSVGSRLHGNVAALLNNTPCIFMPKDARERELDNFHHFNSFPAHKIAKDVTLEQLIEKSDFKVFEKYQKQNYDNFLSFLDINKIDHIDMTSSRSAPYDNYIKDIEFPNPVKSFKDITEEQWMRRLQRCFGGEFYKNENLIALNNERQIKPKI